MNERTYQRLRESRQTAAHAIRDLTRRIPLPMSPNDSDDDSSTGSAARTAHTIRVNNQRVDIRPPAGHSSVSAKAIIREAGYYPYRRTLYKHTHGHGIDIDPSAPAELKKCAGREFDNDETVNLGRNDVYVALRDSDTDPSDGKTAAADDDDANADGESE